MTYKHKVIVAGCIAAYVAAELLSYAQWRQKVNHVKQQELPGLSPKFNLQEWQKWFIMHMKIQPHPKDLLETIFQAPIHRISRERAMHWLCWHMTMRELESYSDFQYPDEIIAACTEILEIMESKGKFYLHCDPETAWLSLQTETESTHGINAKVVDFIRIGRGSINAFYKPLLAQGIIFTARLYAEGELKAMGFVRTVDKYNIVFWIRKHRVSENDKESKTDPIRPLFFCHGMGFGAVPYIHFIRSLLDDRRTTVIPEWPSMSQGWKDNMRPDGMTAELYADGVAGLVKNLRNSDESPAASVDVIGHSFVSNP